MIVFLFFPGLDASYLLSQTGKKSCTSGAKILDVQECKNACSYLEINLSGRTFKRGKACYKGGSGVCNQDGRQGSGATLVCSLIKSIVTYSNIMDIL